MKNKSTFLSTVNKITPIAPCLVAVDPVFPNGRGAAPKVGSQAFFWPVFPKIGKIWSRDRVRVLETPMLSEFFAVSDSARSDRIRNFHSLRL